MADFEGVGRSPNLDSPLYEFFDLSAVRLWVGKTEHMTRFLDHDLCRIRNAFEQLPCRIRPNEPVVGGREDECRDLDPMKLISVVHLQDRP